MWRRKETLSGGKIFNSGFPEVAKKKQFLDFLVVFNVTENVPPQKELD